MDTIDSIINLLTNSYSKEITDAFNKNNRIQQEINCLSEKFAISVELTQEYSVIKQEMASKIKGIQFAQEYFEQYLTYSELLEEQKKTKKDLSDQITENSTDIDEISRNLLISAELIQTYSQKKQEMASKIELIPDAQKFFEQYLMHSDVLDEQKQEIIIFSNQIDQLNKTIIDINSKIDVSKNAKDKLISIAIKNISRFKENNNEKEISLLDKLITILQCNKEHKQNIINLIIYLAHYLKEQEENNNYLNIILSLQSESSVLTFINDLYANKVDISELEVFSEYDDNKIRNFFLKKELGYFVEASNTSILDSEDVNLVNNPNKKSTDIINENQTIISEAVDVKYNIFSFKTLSSYMLEKIRNLNSNDIHRGYDIGHKLDNDENEKTIDRLFNFLLENKNVDIDKFLGAIQDHSYIGYNDDVFSYYLKHISEYDKNLSNDLVKLSKTTTNNKNSEAKELSFFIAKKLDIALTKIETNESESVKEDLKVIQDINIEKQYPSIKLHNEETIPIFASILNAIKNLLSPYCSFLKTEEEKQVNSIITKSMSLKSTTPNTLFLQKQSELPATSKLESSGFKM